MRFKNSAPVFFLQKMAPLFFKRESVPHFLIALLLLAFDLWGHIALPQLMAGVSHPGQLSFYWIALWGLSKCAVPSMEWVLTPVFNEALKNFQQSMMESFHHLPLEQQEGQPIGEFLSVLRRLPWTTRTFFRIFFISILVLLSKVLVNVAMAAQYPPALAVLVGMVMASCALFYVGAPHLLKSRKAAWKVSDRVQRHLWDNLSSTVSIRQHGLAGLKSSEPHLAQEAKAWGHYNRKLQIFFILQALVWAIGFGFYATQVLFTLPRDKAHFYLGIFLNLYFSSRLLLVQDVRNLLEFASDIDRLRYWQHLQTKAPRTPAIALPASTSSNWREARLEVRSVVHDQITICNTPGGEISLQLKPHDCLWIRGKTGVGKTTLLKIIMGLYQPQKGQVLWKGQKRLYIPQDAQIWNAGLLENLQWGLPPEALSGPNQEESLWTLLRKVGLEERFSKLPHPWHTPLGDRGLRLSGGEKQRLVVARLLLQKPDLACLDESFHALDMKTEAELLSLLVEAIPILILVSHRSSIANWVTQILDLEQAHVATVV